MTNWFVYDHSDINEEEHHHFLDNELIITNYKGIGFIYPQINNYTCCFAIKNTPPMNTILHTVPGTFLNIESEKKRRGRRRKKKKQNKKKEVSYRIGDSRIILKSETNLQVVGERKRENILKYVEYFITEINQRNKGAMMSFDRENISVTNILYTVELPYYYGNNLHELRRSLTSEFDYCKKVVKVKIARVDTTKFPGIAIRFTGCSHKFTVVVYDSGSFLILAIKKKTDVFLYYKILLKFIYCNIAKKYKNGFIYFLKNITKKNYMSFYYKNTHFRNNKKFNTLMNKFKRDGTLLNDVINRNLHTVTCKISRSKSENKSDNVNFIKKTKEDTEYNVDQVRNSRSSTFDCHKQRLKIFNKYQHLSRSPSDFMQYVKNFENMNNLC